MMQFQLFKINKFSGKISYVLSARDISITHSDHASYWSWSNVSDSRSVVFLSFLKTSKYALCTFTENVYNF